MFWGLPQSEGDLTLMSPFGTLSFILRHPLASRRPFAAVSRYAWWQIGCRLKPEIEYRWVDGAKLLVRRGMTGATGNIYCGLHEFADMGFLLHFLQPEDLFLDVGANVGSYTVLASAVCGARAIAVEPDPSSMTRLRHNVECNKQESRVELVQAALGASEGVVRFTKDHDTMNRVAEADDVSTQEVALRTLDDVVGDRSPQLLKMDVEGYEGAVVAGGRNTFAKSSLLAVITETADSDVRDALQSAGFEQYYYDPFKRELREKPINGNVLNQNFLFVREAEGVRRRLAAAPKREIAGVRF